MTTLTVGFGQEYASLKDAVANAQSGDTIDITAGTYYFGANDFPALINNLTIEGVGGIATLIATAQPPNGKALLDVAGTTTLKNLNISGVTVPDANGAAIRYEGGTLDIENSVIHDNQDGILGAADPNGKITINQSEFYDNGLGGDGHTHNIYIGAIDSFTLTNSYIHDANVGHEVKSRAANNDIENNVIADNNSTASYEIDLPNGGNAQISNNVIQKSANSGNRVSIAYGEEGASNPGTTVSITGNTFVSDQANAKVVWDTTDTPFTVSGNSIYGYSAVDMAGYLSNAGFSVLSAMPTFSTSSPVNTSDDSTSTGTGSTGTGSTSTGNTGTGSTGTASTGTGSTDSGDTSSGSTGTGSTSTGSTSTGTGSTGSGNTDTGSTGTGSTSTDSTGSGSTGSGSTATGSTSTDRTSTDSTGSGSTGTGSTGNGGGATIDHTPPNLTFTESGSGIVNRATESFSGTVSDSGSGVAKVEIYDTTSGGTVDLGAAAITGGTFSFTAPNLAEGIHVFSAIATDNAGNASPTSFTGNVLMVDTIAPTIASVTESISGTTSNTSDVISVAVSDSGTGVTRVEVYDTVDGKTVDLGAATLAGNMWSFTASNLAAGTHNFSATATDNAGNTSAAVSARDTVTVAVATTTTSPASTNPPTSTTPPASTAATMMQSVSRNAAGTTTIRGTADANSKVTLTDAFGGKTSTLGSVTAGSDGTWSLSTRLNNVLVNSITATTNAGSPSSASLILSSLGPDKLSGTAGKADVFAFFNHSDHDIVQGFETTAAAGSAHDVIDLSGTGYTSFTQLQPKISGASSAVIRLDGSDSITLTGVAAKSLQASDFRFS